RAGRAAVAGNSRPSVPGGLQIYGKIEFGWMLSRHIGRPSGPRLSSRFFAPGTLIGECYGTSGLPNRSCRSAQCAVCRDFLQRGTRPGAGNLFAATVTMWQAASAGRMTQPYNRSFPGYGSGINAGRHDDLPKGTLPDERHALRGTSSTNSRIGY